MFAHRNLLQGGTNLMMCPAPHSLCSEQSSPCRGIPGAADTCSSHQNTYLRGADMERERKGKDGGVLSLLHEGVMDES